VLIKLEYNLLLIMPFQIYEDEFYSGMYETVQQNSQVFNEASNGTMNIVPREHIGDFSKEAFFTEESDVVTRRDITANTDGAATELDSDEQIGMKLYRRFQWEKKLTDIQRIGYTEEQYSFIVGEQTGAYKMREMLNTSLLGVVTCLAKSNDNYLDITGDSPNTLNYDSMPNLFVKFGDRANRLQHIVGHSKPLYDLMGDSFGTQTDNVAGFALNTGEFPLLGRSLAITDSSDLTVTDGVSSGVPSYRTLALQGGAVTIEESEPEDVVQEVITGKENLIVRTQGEFEYTLKIKGFKYDDTGANPNNAALGNAANWTQVATDTKLTPGVFIETA